MRTARACRAARGRRRSRRDRDAGITTPACASRLPRRSLLAEAAAEQLDPRPGVGLAVDANDHVWIIHRPASLTPEEAAAAQKPPTAMCCVPAPPVVEFDADGQRRAGVGRSRRWLRMVSGRARHPRRSARQRLGRRQRRHRQPRPEVHARRQVPAADRQGRASAAAATTRRRSADRRRSKSTPAQTRSTSPTATRTNASSCSMPRPAPTSGTGAGTASVPVDGPLIPPAEQTLSKEPYDPAAPPSRQFRGPVHAVAISTRRARLRHRPHGKSRPGVPRRAASSSTSCCIRPETRSLGTAWDVALSRDPEQQWLVGLRRLQSRRLADRSQDDEDRREPFGSGGRNAGQFGWVHNLDMDSKGNVYTAEVETGKRVQKFTPASKLVAWTGH